MPKNIIIYFCRGTSAVRTTRKLQYRLSIILYVKWCTKTRVTLSTFDIYIICAGWRNGEFDFCEVFVDDFKQKKKVVIRTISIFAKLKITIKKYYPYNLHLSIIHIILIIMYGYVIVKIFLKIFRKLKYLSR